MKNKQRKVNRSKQMLSQIKLCLSGPDFIDYELSSILNDEKSASELQMLNEAISMIRQTHIRPNIQPLTSKEYDEYDAQTIINWIQDYKYKDVPFQNIYLFLSQYNMHAIAEMCVYLKKKQTLNFKNQSGIVLCPQTLKIINDWLSHDERLEQFSDSLRSIPVRSLLPGITEFGNLKINDTDLGKTMVAELTSKLLTIERFVMFKMHSNESVSLLHAWLGTFYHIAETAVASRWEFLSQKKVTKENIEEIRRSKQWLHIDAVVTLLDDFIGYLFKKSEEEHMPIEGLSRFTTELAYALKPWSFSTGFYCESIKCGLPRLYTEEEVDDFIINGIIPIESANIQQSDIEYSSSTIAALEYYNNLNFQNCPAFDDDEPDEADDLDDPFDDNEKLIFELEINKLQCIALYNKCNLHKSATEFEELFYEENGQRIQAKKDEVIIARLNAQLEKAKEQLKSYKDKGRDQVKQINALQNENAILRKNSNKNLQQRINQLQHQNKELAAENRNLLQQNSMDADQKRQLREHANEIDTLEERVQKLEKRLTIEKQRNAELFALINEPDDEEQNEEELFNEANLLIAQEAKMLFFVPNWADAHKLQKYFPNSKFYTDITSEKFVAGRGYSQAIVCIEGASHAWYRRFCAQCDKNDIEYHHVATPGIKRVFSEAINLLTKHKNDEVQ